MAVRFAASGDALSRSTGLPSISSFTLMGWFRVRSARAAAFACFLSFGEFDVDDYYELYVGGASGLVLGVWNGAFAGPTGSTLTVDTWYHLAMVVKGTSTGDFLCYLNGALDITFDGAPGNAAIEIDIGSSPEGIDWLNGAAAHIKVYSAVLTQSEIAQEMWSARPVRMANLNAWHPLWGISDTGDYSGNGNNFTIEGALATEEAPPVGWGPGPPRIYQRTLPASTGAALSDVWPFPLQETFHAPAAAAPNLHDSAPVDLTLPWHAAASAGSWHLNDSGPVPLASTFSAVPAAWNRGFWGVPAELLPIFGTAYSETGLLLSLILAQLGKTEAWTGTETGRAVPLLALLGKTEAWAGSETGRALTLLAVLAGTDHAAFADAARAQTILALSAGTDRGAFLDNRSQTLLTQCAGSDAGAFVDAHGATILALLAASDARAGVETGLAQSILALLGETDGLSYTETGLQAALILALLASTSAWTGTETRGQTVLAQLAGADRSDLQDAGAVSILAALAGADAAARLDAAALIVRALTAASDAGAFVDSRGQVLIAGTAGQDARSGVETARAVDLLALTGGAATWAGLESGRVSLLAQLAGSDRFDGIDLRSLTLLARTAGGDVGAFLDLLRAQVLLALTAGTSRYAAVPVISLAGQRAADSRSGTAAADAQAGAAVEDALAAGAAASAIASETAADRIEPAADTHANADWWGAVLLLPDGSRAVKATGAADTTHGGTAADTLAEG